eukprot:9671966-Ditylum_brightwellii.AAC.1
MEVAKAEVQWNGFIGSLTLTLWRTSDAAWKGERCNTQVEYSCVAICVLSRAPKIVFVSSRIFVEILVNISDANWAEPKGVPISFNPVVISPFSSNLNDFHSHFFNVLDKPYFKIDFP